MHLIEINLVLILAVALLGAIARRLPVPLPILLVAGGFALSFVPGFDHLRLEPDVFFLLFIPPLLFADAWLIPKRELLVLRYPILLLALGLVLCTVLVVGYTVHALIPGVPLAAAFALGAAVSPTDTVAVSATTEQLKLPNRMVNMLGGESLVNDASGLVAFKFAVAAVVTGAFSLAEATISFLTLAGGGVVIGFTIAAGIQQLRLWLADRGLSEPSISTTLSLLTPYAAFIVTEHYWHFSGILAAVAAGVYAGIHDTRHLTMATRLHAWNVWKMLLFVFNGLVFVLLGLQLRQVMAGMNGYSWSELLFYALAVYLIITAVRLLWIIPFSRVALWLTRLHQPDFQPAPWRQVFVVGWAGMRGAVTLAAALSIPLMAGEAPFPARDLLIFLAASVIVITLLINGLTLPLLIRWLNITGDDLAQREEREARIKSAEAALRQLRASIQQQCAEAAPAYQHAFAAQLIAEYERRIEHAGGESEDHAVLTIRVEAERKLRLAALHAERGELKRLSARKVINENVLRILERELDFVEASLIGVGEDF
jgi:monovalent cation/hydrogen antiporter